MGERLNLGGILRDTLGEGRLRVKNCRETVSTQDPPQVCLAASAFNPRKTQEGMWRSQDDKIQQRSRRRGRFSSSHFPKICSESPRTDPLETGIAFSGFLALCRKMRWCNNFPAASRICWKQTFPATEFRTAMLFRALLECVLHLNVSQGPPGYSRNQVFGLLS